MSLPWFMDISFFLFVCAVVDMFMSLLFDFLNLPARIEKKARERMKQKDVHSPSEGRRISDDCDEDEKLLNESHDPSDSPHANVSPDSDSDDDEWKQEWDVRFLFLFHLSSISLSLPLSDCSPSDS